MNDQPEILKMTFDNDMVLSQPEIKYENYKYEIVFYVKPDADLSKLQLTPIIELSKGAIVKPVSGEVVDFRKPSIKETIRNLSISMSYRKIIRKPVNIGQDLK